jgi:hypothetical protein
MVNGSFKGLNRKSGCPGQEADFTTIEMLIMRYHYYCSRFCASKIRITGKMIEKFEKGNL